MANLYRAIGKSMASRYAVYAFNLLSLMVLTRLFKPEIFGMVAAAQTIVTLFQLMAEGGLTPAIINLRQLGSKDRDGIFGLSLSIAVASAVCMFVLGPALARFYGMSQLQNIAPFVALALFANTAVVLPQAFLQRQQFFKRMAQAGIMAEIGALGTTFAAHFALSELHSYALYFPIKALLNFALMWHFSHETEFGQPKPGSNFAAIKPMLGTTGFQLGFNFVNYFSRNLDNILVGKYIGAGALGIYDRSYQLMRYPLLLLTFAMVPAIQPVLRNITHDVNEVSRLHRDLVFKLSILGSLAAIGVFALARPIVQVILGDQWLSVVPIIRLLALIIPVQIVLSTSGSFFQAFNRTDLMLYCGIFSVVVNASVMLLALMHGGLETLCWALFVSFHICFLQAYYLMHRYLFHGGYLRFLISVWPVGLTAITLASIAAVS